MRIDDRDRLTIRSGIIFLLLAHLYRWTNAIYNHDSLLINQIDSRWQISLGRIWNPLYVYLRGRIVSPVTCAVCGSVFLIAAMLLTVRLLDIRRKSSVILLCGMMATHETLAFVNSGFLLSFDLDMLALLFSVLAVWFSRKEIRMHWLLMVICLTACLGLFQSYLEVTLVLIQILILREMLAGESADKLWGYGIRCIIALIAGGAVYLICLRLVLRLSGVQAANTYNGLMQIKDLIGADLLSLLKKTWLLGFRYMCSPETMHRGVSAALNIILGLAAGGLLLVYSRRQKWKPGHYVLLLFLAAVMPLSMNVSYFLTSGMKHGLMTYSFVMYFVLVIMVFDVCLADQAGWQSRFHILPKLGLAVLIFNHISFANALYVKKDLEYDAALSLMTRLTYRMETTEGYVVGETPIAVLGVLDDSPLSVERGGFAFVNDMFVGTMHRFGLSYLETYGLYFRNILGYPVKMVPEDDLKDVMQIKEVMEMPVFPYEGSVKMVEGTLVIKLSEDMRTEKQRGGY